MGEPTPGPWRASQGGGVYAGERLVALTKGVDDNERFPNAQIKEYGQQSKANCRLIAAAPALFEALAECLLQMNESPQIAMDALDLATGGGEMNR